MKFLQGNLCTPPPFFETIPIGSKIADHGRTHQGIGRLARAGGDPADCLAHFQRAAEFTRHPALLFITNLTSIGWVGVDMFFVLSGYLITSILLRTKDGESYFKNFYVRRILRIFPLYYIGGALLLFLLPRLDPIMSPHPGTPAHPAALPAELDQHLRAVVQLTQYLSVTWSLAIV